VTLSSYKLSKYLWRVGDSKDPEWLSIGLLVGYGIFLAGFFLVPTAYERYHHDFYYRFLAIVSLLLIPRGLGLLRHNLLFAFLVIYLSYMVASGLWTEAVYFDEEIAKLTLKYLKRTLFILLFFLLTAVIRKQQPERFDDLLRILCIVASVSSVLTLFIWYRENPFPLSRPEGFTTIRWTIFTAYVYGTFCILSASYFFKATGLFWRTLFGLATLILLNYVLISQSRMAIGAVAIGLIVLFLSTPFRKSILFALLAAVSAAVTIVWVLPHGDMGLLERGLAYRPEIWGVYLEHALDSLLLGEGYFTDPRAYVDVPGLVGLVPHAHSGYLGTLRDGGIVGLILLTTVLGSALWQSYGVARRSGDYLYLALVLHLAACLATDTDRLITRVGALWIFIWLPLALVMTERSIAANVPT
jgi:O-antigen ligase